jgi:hypothetical protein
MGAFKQQSIEANQYEEQLIKQEQQMQEDFRQMEEERAELQDEAKKLVRVIMFLLKEDQDTRAHSSRTASEAYVLMRRLEIMLERNLLWE